MFYVTRVCISVSFFTHSIKLEKLDRLLADEINKIAQRGFEIVCVIPLNLASYNFFYQIVYKDPEPKEVLSSENDKEIESKPVVEKPEPIKQEINYEVIDTSINTITDESYDFDSTIDVGDKVVVIDDTICEGYIIKKYSVGEVKNVLMTFGGKEYIVDFVGYCEFTLKRRDIAALKQ